MRTMNCRNVRREIEEVATGESLSLSANDHLKTCLSCATFREERLKLREMLSSLGAIEAPGDFDFRLRARLAKEDHGRLPYVMRNLSFGFRAATAAMMLVLVGAALLFINFRTAPDRSFTASEGKPSANVSAISEKGEQPKSAPTSTVASRPRQVDPASAVDEKKSLPPGVRRNGFKQAQVASLPSGTNRGLKSHDFSSTPARVLKARDTVAEGPGGFPIGTSFQSLKVSLDDGRGTSRTISVPSVSFGSQRSLSSGSSPLLASARSDW